jgi:hypothetical protein
MTKNLLLTGFACAALALTSCSSEPSDFRPEAKVSLDQVAPGTRSSDNFDQGTADEPNQAKGGAIAAPISSNVPFEGKGPEGTSNPHTADQATSQNAEQVERTKKGSDAAKMDAEVHKMPKGTTGNQLNEE